MDSNRRDPEIGAIIYSAFRYPVNRNTAGSSRVRGSVSGQLGENGAPMWFLGVLGRAEETTDITRALQTIVD
jgi:hypothetical protein